MNEKAILYFIIGVLLVGMASANIIDDILKFFGFGEDIEPIPDTIIEPIPEIIIKPIENKTKEITYATKWTRNSEITEDSSGHGIATFYAGQVFANSNGTRLEDAPSLMNCEFCDSIKLNIELDKDYPIEVIDYNLTSIKLKLEVTEKQKGKDIPIKVYEKEDILNEKYYGNINFKDAGKTNELILPFGLDKEVKWGNNSSKIYIKNETGDSNSKQSTVNGYPTTWAKEREKTTGTLNNNLGANSYENPALANAYGIGRAHIIFNTSIIPDDAVIINVTLNLTYNSKEDGDNDGYDYIAVTKLFSTNDIITTSEFNKCGNVTITNNYDFTTTISPFYFTFLNNSNLNVTGYTKLCLREGHDLENNQITNNLKSEYLFITFQDAFDRGPNLIVEYNSSSSNSTLLLHTFQPANNTNSNTANIILNATVDNGDDASATVTFWNATNNALLCTNASIDDNAIAKCPVTLTAGTSLWWKVNASDGSHYSSVYGNYNVSYFIPDVPANSCTYSGSGNFNINAADNCNLGNNNVNGIIYCYGTGTLTFSGIEDINGTTIDPNCKLYFSTTGQLK